MKTKKEAKQRTRDYSTSKEINELMFWISILVLAISNFLLTFAIVPLLLAASWLTMPMVMLFGFFAGYLFAKLIGNIEHLEGKHHVIAATAIPGLAIINLFLLVSAVNRAATALGITSGQDPLPASIAYTVAFLAPYLSLNVINRKTKYAPGVP